jgi:hypothetical protein
MKIRGSTPSKANFAPAEGVTPPAEVHALPNREFGTLHDPLPLPAYGGDRLAFAPHTAGLWPDCFYVGLTHGPKRKTPGEP